MQSTHPISDSLLTCLFEMYQMLVMFNGTSYRAESEYTGNNLRSELGNISRVLRVCLERWNGPSHKADGRLDKVLTTVYSLLHLSRTVIYYDVPLLSRAIECSTKHGLLSTTARLWALKGSSEFDLLVTDAALSSSSKALDLYRKVKDTCGEADCLSTMSDIYQNLDLMEDATQSLKSALGLYDAIGSTRGRASALHKLGGLYTHDGEVYKVSVALNRALKLYEDLCDHLHSKRTSKSG